MQSYTPPLREMRFVIEEVLQAPAAWAAMPEHADLDIDTAAAVLEEAGRFASGLLAPLNAVGDRQGCRLADDGRVHTPEGFADAYRAFVQGGWPALACAPEHGGQGLPMLLDAAVGEMWAAANHGWTMYPGLLHGAYDCLRHHADPALQALYLPKVASGEWLATMHLTEPQAGSDLGLLRSRAEPAGMGLGGLPGLPAYRLHGVKQFISGAAHDLTDNTVHLVLARLPDAPAGSRGLSLFLAPQRLPDGSHNPVRCTGLEHKMGLHGSATCAVALEGALGWLVGQPHRGLQAMFVMMNAARLHVGLQGLGHLEQAQRHAWAYARERVQGRGRPIAEHPAMRRLLWTLRADAEAGRVLAYETAMLLDTAHHGADADQRAEAEGQASLLTPVVKAGLTALGHHGADAALQVWGGTGYTRDAGIEQTVRDSRVAMLYEGTNEIQALDLLQRKVLADQGAAFGRRLAAIQARAEAAPASLAGEAAAVRHAVQAARAALEALAPQAEDTDRVGAAADDFLAGSTRLLLADAALRIAQAAAPGAADDPWRAERLAAARWGLLRGAPEAVFAFGRVSSPVALPA